MSLAETNWRLRDWIAAAILFAGSAAFVAWQNSRVAVLWDLAYLLDSSWRMGLGQMPYRDFPFVHPPGTFLIQATLMRLFGRHFLLSVTWAALASGLGTLLAWRIALRVVKDWWAALAIAAPLTVLGLYAIYPHPIYDGDCVLAALFAVWFLVRIDCAASHRGVFGENGAKAPGSGRAWAAAAGLAATGPLWFKQNIGLAFVFAVVACVLIVWVREWLESSASGRRSQMPLVLSGMVFAVGAAVLFLATWGGVGNFVHWTVLFAAQRRMPGMGLMLSVYAQPTLWWMLPMTLPGLLLCCADDRVLRRYGSWAASAWLRWVGVALALLPFAWCAVQFVLNEDADDRTDALLALWPDWLLAAALVALIQLRRGVTLLSMLPFVLLAAVHGTLMSQQLWGSTYALWPLLALLLATCLAAVPGCVERRTLACGMGTVLLVCGGVYAVSLERLSYIDQPNPVRPDALLERSHIPALRGMRDSGPYLKNLDELVRYAQAEIPAGDAVLLLPGEDPFYFATGRTPQFPVLLFDPATDPYGPRELMHEASRRGVRWVIVKRALQVKENVMPGADETLRMVAEKYRLVKKLEGYDVYRD